MIKDKIYKNTSCFKEHRKYGVSCKNSSCRHWINHKESNNCVIISSSKGPKTLQEIGDIFNLSRMRVCQIEKNIIQKLSKNLKS